MSQNSPDKKTTVMIVDDSALVRKALTGIISTAPDIEIIATASNPFMAAEKLKEKLPQVLILDIEMPEMDGLTFLKKIMEQKPIPIIICSSLAREGSDTFHRAMEYGAIEVITKPNVGTLEFFEESAVLICDTIRAAAHASLQNLRRMRSFNSTISLSQKHSADVILPKYNKPLLKETTEKIIAIGASTGGTEAIRVLLESLPVECPGIIIVQHMPEKFTRSFSERLNDLCAVTVREAVDGDNLLRGQVLIAPGNHHMILKRSGHKYYVSIVDGDLVNRHRPSVDVLFRSVANYGGTNAVGVLLTGMGDDGAAGLLEMKNAGAFTIAQDEATCVVYGMPKSAIALGGVSAVLPLQDIAGEMIKRSSI